jgi:hypothetical protein
MADKTQTDEPYEMIPYEELYEMLTYKRPHGSKSERKFIARFIDSIPGVRIDGFGNRMVFVGDSRTVFSAHTDTVHLKGGKQKIIVDEVGGYIYKDDNEPLGADDATGIFIMRRMIEAGVPGLYIFHRGEECGGLGSSFIAKETPDLLTDIDRAIAFDRKADCSVISHQGWEECASPTFCLDLAARIGGAYAPDDGGVFTDTANYTHLVPECTNISVGYYQEHTKNETQDLSTLDDLIPALIAIDWESLPTKRDPLDAYTAQEALHTGYYTGTASAHDQWAEWATEVSMGVERFDDYQQALFFVEDYPQKAAQLLWDLCGKYDVECSPVDQQIDQGDPWDQDDGTMPRIGCK